MDKEEIRAIALEVGSTMHDDWDLSTEDWCVKFATHFLAAINAKAEPFCYHYITNGTWDFFTKELPPDDAYDEGTLTKLFTHPAIEPAGEVVVTTTEEGRCVCVTLQDEEGRILKVLWEAPAIEPAPLSARSLTDELMDCVDRLGSEYNTVDPRVWEHLMVYAPTPVCAPQLPDEVREIVDRLRAYPTRDGLLAAEMIERLARQVTEGCVVVQRKVTEEAKCVMATPGNYRTYQDQWTALIAAGEVKP